METSDRASLLIQWLRQLHQSVAQLLDLLEQERECLQASNLEALVLVVDDKHAVVARIDQLMAQLSVRNQPLESVMEQSLAALSDPEADSLWQNIKDVIQRCRQLNEANGARIALLQEHNQQSLALLFGQRRQLVGYSADGRSQREDQNRLIGAG